MLVSLHTSNETLGKKTTSRKPPPVLTICWGGRQRETRGTEKRPLAASWSLSSKTETEISDENGHLGGNGGPVIDSVIETKQERTSWR